MRRGQTVLALEADGTVKGCPSLATVGFAGGNVRDLTLEDIWRSSKEIHFGRLRSVEDLWGFCRGCYYADVCRGGCTWTSHSLLGVPGNNPYCHYRATELEKSGLRERVVKIRDAARTSFAMGEFELITERVADGTVVTTSTEQRRHWRPPPPGPDPEMGRVPAAAGTLPRLPKLHRRDRGDVSALRNRRRRGGPPPCRGYRTAGSGDGRGGAPTRRAGACRPRSDGQQPGRQVRAIITRSFGSRCPRGDPTHSGHCQDAPNGPLTRHVDGACRTGYVAAMDTVLNQSWTTESFLAWEDRQEFRDEFDGRGVVPMIGGSIAHQRIVFNLCLTLMGLLDGRPLMVSQEMRLRIGGRGRDRCHGLRRSARPDHSNVD